MAKRANEESVVDLTLDSDDEKPIVSPAKKVAVEPRRPGTSPKKPVLLEGTPATMRSRELIAKLRTLGVSEREIVSCSEKHELVALLDRQRGRAAGVVASNPFLDTPPTAPRASAPSAKMERSGASASAAYLGAMGAIRPAIPLVKQHAKPDLKHMAMDSQMARAQQQLARAQQQRQQLQQMQLAR